MVERQAGDHFDGVPFYGPKSDISGPEISNRLAGSKRSNSDSFMGSSRDGVPQIGPESLESSHLMKVCINIIVHGFPIIQFLIGRRKPIYGDRLMVIHIFRQCYSCLNSDGC